MGLSFSCVCVICVLGFICFLFFLFLHFHVSGLCAGASVLKCTCDLIKIIGKEFQCKCVFLKSKNRLSLQKQFYWNGNPTFFRTQLTSPPTAALYKLIGPNIPIPV